MTRSLQSLYHLRENPVITWVSLLGTALSICMIMVVVITLRARTADCAPEVNRSRTLYVPNMTARPKGATDGGMNSRMSVQTGRECFKALTTPEAVTLYADVEKVRVSLPAGQKLTADMRQVDTDFWRVFQFRFLDGKPFRAPCPAWSWRPTWRGGSSGRRKAWRAGTCC